MRKFGSIEEAWTYAFDTDGSGSVNFTEFGLGCKAAGYVGNATRLWAALDEDRSGEISLEELGAEGEGGAVVPSLTNGRASRASEASLTVGKRMTLLDLLLQGTEKSPSPAEERKSAWVSQNQVEKRDIHEQSTELPSEPSQDWTRPLMAESGSTAQLPGMVR